MDRTDEWKSLLNLHNIKASDQRISDNWKVSDGLQLGARISANLEGNEALLSRMTKLITRKEFSNDPTAAIAEISDVFQGKMVAAQNDLGVLKKMLENPHHSFHNYTWSAQQRQHYKLLLDCLQKRAAAHLELFQNSIRTHAEHVETRKRRVVKYGQSMETLSSQSSSQHQFAMFNDINRPSNHQQLDDGRLSAVNSGPVRRKGARASAYIDNNSNSDSNEGWKGKAYSSQHQALQERHTTVSDSRLQNAQKIEATITQMGQLFVQMATLVKEQSTTIARIEDDVETGLTDTVEAHDSIMKLYEITKGNRSIILKIFLLLVFFIFLFLVWT